MKKIKIEDLSFTDEEKERLLLVEKFKQFLTQKQYDKLLKMVFKDKIKEAKRQKR